jgi:hypothetical protein
MAWTCRRNPHVAPQPQRPNKHLGSLSSVCSTARPHMPVSIAPRGQRRTARPAATIANALCMARHCGSGLCQAKATARGATGADLRDLCNLAGRWTKQRRPYQNHEQFPDSVAHSPPACLQPPLHAEGSHELAAMPKFHQVNSTVGSSHDCCLRAAAAQSAQGVAAGEHLRQELESCLRAAALVT